MQQLAKIMKHTDLLMGLGLLAVVSMLILPLPEWLLDLGLVTTMAASIIILLTSVNVKEPLQFSVFPSLLLVTTLLRLSLSIAATKLILGSGSAGNVISTFGTFVLGGNFVVGFISFLILMIVQFIVITQGSTRVSEVVARFTLDAMPGKQMAIDADLAAGLIDEDQARSRRKAVKQEADFYGSMDGASKFVKGDAIASLLIITINIIGGFLVGFMRGEGDPMAVLSTYAMLSVGEGLVSQIPALLISTASGLLVTRNGQEVGMGGTMFGQILNQHRVLATAGLAIAAFAFIPGFPTFIFLGLGGFLFAISRIAQKNPNLIDGMMKSEADKKPASTTPAATGPSPSSPEGVLPLVMVDNLEIEIGYGLTKLADPRAGGDLPERVAATRKQIATEIGYVMPSVRIRDNAMLGSTEYVIKLRGEDLGKSEASPDQLLAIDSGAVFNPLPGTVIREPVFGLNALWIDPGMREMAERSGYTVVEPAAMIATHLSEIVKTHSAELLSRQDVTVLLDTAKKANEAVVNDLQPAGVLVGDVQKVLQHLLRERIPIRDLITILETMSDFSGRIKDSEQMGELVRASLARTITRQYVDEHGKLFCITLEPTLERQFQEGLQQTAGGLIIAGDPPGIRLPLHKIFERAGVQIPVLAYNEVSAQAEVEFVAQASLHQAQAA
ncbi:MAG: flagellar biosynthesis protein FlhA [Fimbriimonadaceae bacterium]|nr:flagellar biosynthesis protein FlhA [Fimbriimonadaceae bacterium]